MCACVGVCVCVCVFPPRHAEREADNNSERSAAVIAAKEDGGVGGDGSSTFTGWNPPLNHRRSHERRLTAGVT